MAAAPAGPASVKLSSSAERIYSSARPRLLQIRTLVAGAGRQSSVGSGFLLAAEGLALTNYHVVSQYAMEPDAYRMEYLTPDGGKGPVTLIAVDITNDLAIVRLDHGGWPFFHFDPLAVSGKMSKGERLYSMGNPLDIGFTIIEGTYNGLVERSYNDRIHFSGALNPGMSGGPAVDDAGNVVGVNVATSMRGEMVSFLVPARFAAQLFERATQPGYVPPKDFRPDIQRQMEAWGEKLYANFAGAGFRESVFGPYQAPESAASWFTCWAQTNAGDIPRPRASSNTSRCSSESDIYVDEDLITGSINITHTYLKSVDLNPFQFAKYLSRSNRSGWLGMGNKKWHTPQRCYENFLEAWGGNHALPLRVVWCARAYRKFNGLYDVSATAVTQDNGHEALVSRISMQGITFEAATALSRKFLEALQWAK